MFIVKNELKIGDFTVFNYVGALKSFVLRF